MTQEEKAKAYDEAIEKLRDFYRDYDTVSCLIDVKEELANLFPELKESDDVDKKIREEIIATIHLYYGKPLEDEAKEMITWLEKQGELINSLSKGLNNAHERIDELIQKNNELCIKLEKQDKPVEINPTEFDTRLQALIGKFNSLPKEELIGSLSFWLNVVKNDGTYKPDEKQGEFAENNKDDVDTDFTIYHPLKNGEGHYECIPYSFYGVLSSFSEDKDMIDFLRLCFYTEEECNEWIKQNESIDICDSLIIKNKEFPASEKRDFGYFSEPTDKIEPKFKVGDWVIYMGTTAKILDLQKHCYVGKDTNNKDFVVSYCNECEMRKWNISDAKDGDVLSNGEMIVIFKHFVEPSYRQHIVAYIGLDTIGGIQVTDEDWELGIDKAKPATKEQCDTLFAKMKEEGWKWDAKKKELKKIEQKSTENLTDVDHEYYSNLLSNDDSDNIDDYAYQCAYCMSHDWMKETATWEDVQKAVKLGAEWKKQKSTWSEEDEKKRELLIAILNVNHPNGYFKVNPIGTTNMEAMSKDELVSWLKSIRPQKHIEWSEEDDYNLQCMIAKAVKDIQNGNVGRNNELIYWLKSIKQRIVGKV